MPAVKLFDRPRRDRNLDRIRGSARSRRSCWSLASSASFARMMSIITLIATFAVMFVLGRPDVRGDRSRDRHVSRDGRADPLDCTWPDCCDLDARVGPADSRRRCRLRSPPPRVTVPSAKRPSRRRASRSVAVLSVPRCVSAERCPEGTTASPSSVPGPPGPPRSVQIVLARPAVDPEPQPFPPAGLQRVEPLLVIPDQLPQLVDVHL